MDDVGSTTGEEDEVGKAKPADGRARVGDSGPLASTPRAGAGEGRLGAGEAN